MLCSGRYIQPRIHHEHSELYLSNDLAGVSKSEAVHFEWCVVPHTCSLSKLINGISFLLNHSKQVLSGLFVPNDN